MIIQLPDPAAATVTSVTVHSESVRVSFQVRGAAQRDQLAALLEYAQDGGFAVELRLIRYKGRPSRIER